MRLFRIFACLLFATAAWCQPSDPFVVERPEDLTREALHHAFLGNREALLDLAQRREGYEQLLEDKGRNIVTLSENIAALAASIQEPAPNRREATDVLEDFQSDRSTAVFLKLLQETEPRERYYAARDAHRYERLHRRINTLTNAAGGMLQLQFFALFQVPLDIVQSLTVDREYLTAVQRRQLYAAREVLDAGVRVPSGSKAIVRDWTPRRVNSAALQARENARRAAEQDRLETADWWYEREMALRGVEAPLHAEHRDVRGDLAKLAERAELSRAVVDGDAFLHEPELRRRYSELLDGFIQDAASPAVLVQAQHAIGRFPRSIATDEMRMAAAVHDLARGEPAVAEVQFHRIARTNSGWGKRMEEYLRRPAFEPGLAFDEARDAVNARKWAFLLSGSDPSIQSRHLTSEEARAIESSWITRARSLFLLDTIARFFAYPFLPGSFFPRDEIIEASRTVPPDYLNSAAGRDDLRSLARAYAAERQYADAASVYEKLGDRSTARRMREREAARLLRQAETGTPEEQVELYRRIQNGYPEYAERKKVARRLDRAISRQGIITTITREELNKINTLWNEQGLGLGEDVVRDAGMDGINLMSGGRISYRSKSGGKRVTMEVGEEAVDRALQQLYPRRRGMILREKLNEPREIKRVPLQVEGSALPGFDAAPGLVPLEPNERLRRLYE